MIFMSVNITPTKKDPDIDEEEIFKSLSHQIRREIIKQLGEKELTFTDLKNHLRSIDSPSLSYHLKSLQSLITQKENKYKLTDVGEAAFLLLTKTDQSIKLSKYRRNFLYAYIITVICWISAETIVPLIIGTYGAFKLTWAVQIVINAMAVINMIVIWQLRRRYT